MANCYPWYKLYAAEFIDDEAVKMMSNEQLGMYFRLNCHDWVEGSLPDDPERLQLLALAPDGSPFQSMWELVKDKYEQVAPGRISHRRLIQQRQQNEGFSAAQSFRGKAPRPGGRKAELSELVTNRKLTQANRNLTGANRNLTIIDPDLDLDKEEEKSATPPLEDQPEENGNGHNPQGISFNRQAKASDSDFEGLGVEKVMARLREYEDEFGKKWCDATWYAAVEWAFDNPKKAKKDWRQFLLGWFRRDVKRAREWRKDA